jgi:hypothetical protein
MQLLFPGPLKFRVRLPIDRPMMDGIPPVPRGGIDAYDAARRVRETERGGASFSLAPTGDVPASPPAEVLAGLDGAARVEQQLRERGLRVAFELQPEGDVRVSVVDTAGTVVRELPPAHALDLLSDESRFAELVPS